MLSIKTYTKTLWLAIMQAIVFYAKTQNLVINPSFESHTQCPNQLGQINRCNSWYNGDVNGTCDYYSVLGCSGNFSPPYIHPVTGLTLYQEPLSGLSFAGFIPFYGSSGIPSNVEFLQGKFNTSLVTGNLYYVEFYINSASQQKYFIHDISALITNTQVVVNPGGTYNPQISSVSNVIYKDTTKWMRINGYYTANGGENYITIGNYKPYGMELKDSVANNSISEAYYFIDSVGVYDVTHLDTWDAGPDRFINYGDSVQIGNPNTDYSMFNWLTSINGFTYLSDSTDAKPWSKPWQTTTYYVTKTQGTNIFKDTVTVHVTGGAGIELNNKNPQINIYPNPATTTINITYNLQVATCSLYDVLGNEVINKKEKEIDVSNLSNGVYFIQEKTAADILSKKIVIQH